MFGFGHRLQTFGNADSSPGGSANVLLLFDGASGLLLADGSSFLLLTA